MTKKYQRWDDRTAQPGTSTDGKDGPFHFCDDCTAPLPAGARRCPQCGSPVAVPRSVKQTIASAEAACRMMQSVFKASRLAEEAYARDATARQARQAEASRDAVRKFDQQYAESLAARGLTLNGFLNSDPLRKDGPPLPAGIKLLGGHDG
jgi:hypothetical protein